MHTPPPFKVVLDTNVVLDWLIFKNPGIEDLASQVCNRALVWIACPEMKSELEHVLLRGIGKHQPRDQVDLWSAWGAHATEQALPMSRPPAAWPRCTDRDDQKFIDLALAHHARWLVTRDRAVLKTAKRCRNLGLDIVTPEQWRKQVFPVF